MHNASIFHKVWGIIKDCERGENVFSKEEHTNCYPYKMIKLKSILLEFTIRQFLIIVMMHLILYVFEWCFILVAYNFSHILLLAVNYLFTSCTICVWTRKDDWDTFSVSFKKKVEPSLVALVSFQNPSKGLGMTMLFFSICFSESFPEHLFGSRSVDLQSCSQGQTVALITWLIMKINSTNVTLWENISPTYLTLGRNMQEQEGKVQIWAGIRGHRCPWSWS